MPISSQALYFHLALNADDDGVVEAYPVLKMVGCSEDDLRILVTKEFVKILNDDLVSYIMDWHEHNQIRPDRKVDSIYKELLIKVIPDVKIVERRKRADSMSIEAPSEDDGQPMDNQRTTNGQPSDNQRTAQDSIGEDSTSKDRSGNSSSSFTPPTREEVRAYCKERGLVIDPDYFYDYYDSDKWLKGNSRNNKKELMKNWKQTALQWNKKELEKNPQKAEQPSQPKKKTQEEIEDLDAFLAELRKREREELHEELNKY